MKPSDRQKLTKALDLLLEELLGTDVNRDSIINAPAYMRTFCLSPDIYVPCDMVKTEVLIAVISNQLDGVEV